MTVLLINSLIEELNKQLGDRYFFTLQDLHSLGLFQTVYAARKALKDGKLTYIKISPRRRVIPRSVLMAYIRHNISQGDGSLEELSDNDFEF